MKIERSLSAVGASTTVDLNFTAPIAVQSQTSIPQLLTKNNQFKEISTTSENFNLCRTESRQSLSSSQLSISYYNFDYWPEFHQNYNSIMDNTNLLDSCAAALSDITCDEYESSETSLAIKKHALNRTELNLFTESSTNSSNVSSSGGSNSGIIKLPTTKEIEMFMLWLCDMEKKIALQPTLSQIFAMSIDEMSAQLKIHSNIFNDIVAQPCIVKGSKRKSHKLIEERYHLLYLKAYEVLLLLEGLPGEDHVDQMNSSKILNKSFYDIDNLTEEENLSIQNNDIEHNNKNIIDVHNSDNDNNDIDMNESKYENDVKLNNMASNTGIYYFKYNDNNDDGKMLIHKESDESIPDTGSNSDCDDKNEITFTSLYDNELNSFLHSPDAAYISAENITNDSDTLEPLLRSHLSEDTIRFSQKSELWNDLNVSIAINTEIENNNLWQENLTITETHDKVRNWLCSTKNENILKSSVSLDRISIENEGQPLYRTRSEHDLRAIIEANSNNSSSSPLLPQTVSQNSKGTYSSIDCSLEWDDYQPVYDQDGENGFDLDTDNITLEFCEFGNDYSVYLNQSVSTTTDTDSLNAKSANEKFPTNKSEEYSDNSATTTTINELIGEDEEMCRRQKRIRRNRNKRIKKRNRKYRESDYATEAASSTSDINSHIESNISLATTASLDGSQFENDLHENREENFNKNVIEECAPKKSITYNNNVFEIHSNDTNEPIKHKVSELCPEDFNDIITMCQQNIDCVITVLGAEPNRVLTVAYCRQMKQQRYKNGVGDGCNCTKITLTNDSNEICRGNCLSKTNDTCLCAWVAQTIAMIINFLLDCWNIFRNMKLYTYLCRFMRNLFGATRHVANHLRSKSDIVNKNALKLL